MSDNFLEVEEMKKAFEITTLNIELNEKDKRIKQL